jgi:hypothetical protein
VKVRVRVLGLSSPVVIIITHDTKPTNPRAKVRFRSAVTGFGLCLGLRRDSHEDKYGMWIWGVGVMGHKNRVENLRQDKTRQGQYKTITREVRRTQARRKKGRGKGKKNEESDQCKRK